MNDLDRKKSVIYVSLGGVSLLIGAYVVWRMFIGGGTPAAPTGQLPITGSVPGFPQDQTPTPPAPGSAGTSTPPIATLPPEAQKLLRLTDYSVIGPSLNKDETRALFYKKEGGGLYAVDFDAKNTEKLSPITVVGLLDAIWAPAGDRSAVQYLDRDTVKSFLHIGTSSVAVLPPDIRSPTWSPDRKSLAYLITRDGITNLIIADAAGKNPRTVLSNQLRDASIAWITPDKISFTTAPSGRAEGFVFVYSRVSGSLTQVLGPRFGLTARWSPDGSKILASFTNRTGNDLRLALLDPTGKELQRLPLVTLPDKCAWSADGKDIYCAVPRIAPSPDTTWPDDYLAGELALSDRIVEINPVTGDISPILDEGTLSISNLFTTKDKSILFFVNRTDGTLWRYKLKE
ncbi:MAG: PD40 domain-containing protein [Candidatus Sungbacteria bacterium]|nr:PD40 domain-containing protein [Candidatus Sungbacteria bacterium]